MKLSTRSRYGMRAVLELALEYGQGPLQIKTIAEREGISNKYLEQLISILKASGLVRSIRGPKGGYALTKPPHEITVKEVFSILEGPLSTVECIEHPESCERCIDCLTRDIWIEMQQAMLKVLESKTLADLIQKAKKCNSGSNFQI
jgi:Rrf2 family protein